MSSGRAALFLGLVAGVSGALRGYLSEPAWLESAFLPFRYARRISEHGSLLLSGQDVATESFVDPLWTALLALLGSVGVHEMRVQPFLGSALLGILCGLTVFWAARRFARWESTLAVCLVLALPILAVSARSGGDHLFLAVLSLCAVTSVVSDMDQAAPSLRSTFILAILSTAGLAPLLLALSLATSRWQQDRKPLLGVVSALGVMSVARLMFFGPHVLHGPWVLLSQAGPGSLIEALRLTPFIPLGGVLGLLLLWRSGRRSLPWMVGAGVWVLWALLGGNGSEGFGSVLVPALGLLALGTGALIEHLPHRGLAVVVMLAIVGVDLRQSHLTQDSSVHARMSTFMRAKVMAKFVRWRFEGDPLVVVQTPGALPYFLRKRTFDLSGRSHGQAVSLASVQALNAEAMVPKGAIVAKQAKRLHMSPEWDWQELSTTHHQHAIQHAEEWQLIDEHPIWFNLYLRKDLEKHPPKWVDIYAKRKKKREKRKQK